MLKFRLGKNRTCFHVINRMRADMGIVGMLLGKVEDLSWVLKVSVVSWGAKNAKDTVAEGGGWDNQVKVPEAEN